MKKIADWLILLGAFVILGVAAYGDLTLRQQQHPAFLLTWTVKIGEAVGLAALIALITVRVQAWVKSAVAPPPTKTEIITADKRCERLTQSVMENAGERMFTTRYSARSIGQNARSNLYVSALNHRIHDSPADTYRVITLDHTDKVKHAADLLNEHYKNARFGLKVLTPGNIRLIDLLISENHFVCIGIETRNPEENYWIRIDEQRMANEFRNYYQANHWDRPEAVMLKAPGDVLTEAQRDMALSKLNDEARKSGLTVGT